MCYYLNMQDIYSTFEFDKIKNLILDYSKTELGKEKISNLTKIDNFEVLKVTLDKLSEMMSIVVRFGDLPISNSANALNIIELGKKTGILTPHDLNLINEDIKTVAALSKYFEKITDEYILIFEIVSKFNNLSNLAKEINRVITPSLTIFDNASEELQRIRNDLRKAEKTLLNKIQNLSFTYAEYLTNDASTIRDGHFVLAVKTALKSKVAGIVHDISDSGATTFIEPLEVVQLNNEITSLKLEDNEECKKILKALTSLVLIQEKEIINNNAIIGELDFLSAKSHYANNIDAIVPTLTNEKHIFFKEARHPLINKNAVIANSYELGNNKNIVVISGPNAGGKTVSLKTVGLLTLMGLSGLAVPGKDAKISNIKNIYVDIGDNQSLSDNLSTFSAHMNNVGEIANKCTKDDLILLDELGTGTSPKEGEALALSILKHLKEKGCLGMISSHFDALKEYAYFDDSIENSSMIFDKEKLLPTYKFSIGTPGNSYALEVASRFGISKEILDDAKEYLSKKDNNDNAKLFEILQNKVEHISKLEDENIKKSKELENKEKQLKAEKEMLSKKKNELLKNVDEEKKEILKGVKSEVDEIISVLSNSDLKLHEVIELKKKIDSLESEEELINFNENIDVKDYVEIPSMNIKGVVNKIKGEKVVINVDGGLIFECKKSLLHKLDNDKRVNKTIKPHTSKKPVEINTTSFSLELNLIGQHVDEAKYNLEKYIDTAIARNIGQVRIIHGFGSGALRKMVQSFLKECGFSFRSGDEYEGGGGATVVKLK